MGTLIVAEPGQRERAAPGGDARRRGQAQHPGDAEQDLGLLLDRQQLGERPLGERAPDLRVAGVVQERRGPGDQRAAPRILAAQQLERPLAELGARVRIGRAERGDRADQDVDRASVAGRGGGGELLGDRGRRDAAGEQDRHCLALQRDPRRARDAVQDRVPDQVVAERERPVALDEDVGGHELLDRPEQARRAALEHPCQRLERARAPERGRRGGGQARLVAEQAQALADERAHAARQPRRRPGVDDTALLRQAGEQLGEPERVAAGIGGQRQQRGAGLRAERVGHDVDDVRVLQRGERDGGDLHVAGQPRGEAARVRLGRRRDPGDRRAGQLRGDRRDRGDRRVVGAVQVVERDHDGLPRRRLLQQGREARDEPVALLGRGRQVGERGAVEHRLAPGEQRGHQEPERRGAVPGLRRGRAGPGADPLADPDRLLQQPGAAHPGRAADQRDRRRAGLQAPDLVADRVELGRATAQPARRRPGCGGRGRRRCRG